MNSAPKMKKGEKFFTSFSFIKENVTVVTSVYYIGKKKKKKKL